MPSQPQTSSKQQVSIRGFVNWSIAFLLYIACFMGVQIAMGINRSIKDSFGNGLPIVLIAAISAAGILRRRNSVPLASMASTIGFILLTSVGGTLAMSLPLLIRKDTPNSLTLGSLNSLTLGSLIALSAAMAGLSTIMYAEMVRNKFPAPDKTLTDGS